LLVDSHCHLNYLDDPDSRLQAARLAGVDGFLCIGVDKDGIAAVLDIAERHLDVWASVGQHPEAAESPPDWVSNYLTHPRVVAVGETGLDYHHGRQAHIQRLQRERFAWHLEIAGVAGLPVVVHTRDAVADTADLLRAHRDVGGVLHCFTETWDLAKSALDLGYYISISGIVTFRNGENVREVASRVPRDRLLVETDCPWLAPAPHRGRTNEPAFVRDTATFLADHLNWDRDALAAQTSENFFRLFACGPQTAA
jgi:TatD DNase family protein